MAKRKIRTISVTPELTAKLDLFPQENWSAVACRAFEIRVKELELMNITDVQEKAIARLKASKLKATDARYRAGEVAGAIYLLHRAEFSEMERLERWNDTCGNDRLQVIGQMTFRKLAAVMTNEDGTEDDIDAEMRRTNGDDINDEEWLEGFIDGALGKYCELKGQLG